MKRFEIKFVEGTKQKSRKFNTIENAQRFVKSLYDRGIEFVEVIDNYLFLMRG